MPALPAFDAATTLRIAAARAALGSTATRWLIHELRGPVQVLTLAPDLLDPSQPPDTATLRMLSDGAAALDVIAGTLDEFLQRPPAEPTVEPVTLDGLVQLLVRVGRAHRGSVAVEALPAPAELPAVQAVAGWLPHVAGALLVNAVESCEAAGGGTVRLRLQTTPDGAALDVEDDGGGFADPAAAFSGESTKPSLGWPRGLGLPIAQLLARAMGGDVLVTSPTPGATVVRLALRCWGR